MANYIATDTDLTAVANAIRTKGGTSAELEFPSGFVSAVQAIPTGVTPTGTKQISINENGTITEDVSAYASAEITVDVQGGGYSLDEIAMREINGAITLTAERVKDSAFKGTAITSVESLTVTRIEGAAFQNCAALETINFPMLADSQSAIFANAFSGCSSLKRVRSADLGKANSIPQGCFYRCNQLTFIVSDYACSLGYTGVTENPALISVDVGLKDMTVAQTSSYGLLGLCFNKCTALNVLVLRRSAAILPLKDINAFQNTPFASSGAGGTLYVPQALISDYEAATNWSTILGYSNNQILPIEGSIYETQYVDGTPITQGGTI